MRERTVSCADCGASFTVHQLGRAPSRCLDCLSPKARAQRLRRAKGAEPYARCTGPCGRSLSGLRAVPKIDPFCADCGPGPGVTRRATCQHCATVFWRRYRGGGNAPRRAHLCDACETTHKLCGVCEAAKPLAAFSLSRGKRIQRVSKCKPCAAERYHAGDKLGRIAKKFGLTKDQWLALFEQQNGRCAICRAEPTDLPRGYLYVDHDHRCCPGQTSCGRCVRGLLCVRCNFAIGQLDDDVDRLRAAITYLAASEVTPT